MMAEQRTYKNKEWGNFDDQILYRGEETTIFLKIELQHYAKQEANIVLEIFPSIFQQIIKISRH